MRFLCDEMLVRLARLLRTAGYDTYLASGGQKDDALLTIAREENRILLTRDKALARRAHPRSLAVEGRDARQEAQMVSAHLPVDWTLAPFSRCAIDNALLRDATPDEIGRMPPEAADMGGPYRACSACGRVYWPGSHVKRMAARLEDLAQKPPQALL